MSWEKLTKLATVGIEDRVSDFVWNSQDEGITVRLSGSQSPLRKYDSNGNREDLPINSLKLGKDGNITQDEKRSCYLATCGDHFLCVDQNQYNIGPVKVISGKDRCLQGIDYLQQEDLYAVVDVNQCQVCLLEAQTLTITKQFGSKGSGPAQFLRPCNICCWSVAGKSRLVVSDWAAHQLKIFDVHGNYIETIGKGQLLYPRGVCSDRALGLFVADTLNQRVVRYWYENELIKSEILLDPCHLGSTFIPWLTKVKRRKDTIDLAVCGTNSQIHMFSLTLAKTCPK